MFKEERPFKVVALSRWEKKQQQQQVFESKSFFEELVDRNTDFGLLTFRCRFNK